MKKVEVVAAVIKENNKILATQRGYSKLDYISYKFEFPGGKVEKGESQEEALVREIEEELGLGIAVGKKLITVNHSYPDFELTMHTYLCERVNGDIELFEHNQYQWLSQDTLYSVDWAAADVPIVEVLKNEL